MSRSTWCMFGVFALAGVNLLVENDTASWCIFGTQLLLLGAQIAFIFTDA